MISPIVQEAEQLAAAGHHARLVEYLAAREREIEESPSLALLYGCSKARLGRYEEGLVWLDVAMDKARQVQDQSVERHALNARGAVALVSGRIDEAADYFTQGLMAASRDHDDLTVGRCANNLGIIANLRGRYAEALGSWEIGVAAFERAGLRQGVSECRHNLGIAYRQQGVLDRALAEAGLAVEDAEAAGDQALRASALRGQAEIRLARGERQLARQDLDQVREIRARSPDRIEEAEDLRVAALLLQADGDAASAERLLRDVIGWSDVRRRPQLLAEATRDLAMLLRRAGRHAEARTGARTAQSLFTQLGADGEIRALAALDWDRDFSAELRRSLEPLHEAQQLADAGRYVELLGYLSGRSLEELEQSPMLALLFGIAHSRLGGLDVGRQWAMAALSRARAMRHRVLEVRALNVCGAIALERGGIAEAMHFFSRAQEEAMHDNDLGTVGRCANNLGIIANMQGDYGRAIGAYTRAIAAYDQAGNRRGRAESMHNLAIAYREQGRLDDALQSADAALTEAEKLGDCQLTAQALAGRAEIHIARGDAALGLREAERALAAHRELQDPVREAEDMRILAIALSLTGRTEHAQTMLREVIERATNHQRPLLAAIAQRDLAQLLARAGRDEEARAVAREARGGFERLGAAVEIQRLNAILPTLTNQRAPGAERGD
jgi:tetratricopeptide (TPR) repeat protein